MSSDFDMIEPPSGIGIQKHLSPLHFSGSDMNLKISDREAASHSVLDRSQKLRNHHQKVGFRD